MTTIREIRRDEVDLVANLYLEPCRSLSERDAEWGVPDREPIRRWIERTTETDEAVCLVPEIDGDRRLPPGLREPAPAMPGVAGELEELHVRPGSDEDGVRRELVEAGVGWARARDAGVIASKVGLDAPWRRSSASGPRGGSRTT